MIKILYFLCSLAVISALLSSYPNSVNNSEKLSQLKELLQLKNQEIDSLKQQLKLLKESHSYKKPKLALSIYSQSKKQTVLKGETFETELGLKIQEGIKIHAINVNNKSLPIDHGKAIFQYSPMSIGEKLYRTQIIFQYPRSKKLDTLEQEFSFKVDYKMATIASNNHRILYAGRKNELNISSNGLASWEFQLAIRYQEKKHRNYDSFKLEQRTRGRYFITPHPHSVGDTITIQFKNAYTGESIGEPVTYYIRDLKELYAYAMLSDSIFKRKKTITAKEMNKQTKLNASFNPYDYKTYCYIRSYSLDYTPKNGKTQTYYGQYSEFKGEILKRVQQAKSGDQFKFYRIKSNCLATHHGFNKTYDVIYNIE